MILDAKDSRVLTVGKTDLYKGFGMLLDEMCYVNCWQFYSFIQCELMKDRKGVAVISQYNIKLALGRTILFTEHFIQSQWKTSGGICCFHNNPEKKMPYL